LNDSCVLTLSINGETRTTHLTGLLNPTDDFTRRALDTLILADIATAQSLSGTRGKLTQIDLILPEGFNTDVLSAELPEGTLLIPSATRSSQINEMTAAFRFNLTALSLLALLVGVFLIYNTMTFSVIQRRTLFGTLRSIGFTREQVFGMVLSEAAIVGTVGAVLGLGLGILLGQGAVRLVTQTINDLYFVLNVQGMQVSASSLIKGGVAGLAASLLAAAPPAWEAASVSPRLALSRAGLEIKFQSLIKLAAGLGILIAIIGAAILSISTRDLIVSFTGTFAVIIGLAALTPMVTTSLMRLLGVPLGRVFGLLGRLAPRNVIRSQSRTAIAVAALMLAVSVTIGVQVMIGSFRTTVTIWLEQTLRGDIYIASQGLSGARLDTPLDPQVIDRVQSLQVAEYILPIRVLTVESEYGPVELIAAGTDRQIDSRLFLAAQGSPETAWQMVREGGILLSEPLANRLGISTPGGTLSLLTPDGWVPFRIAGIYADYTSTRGTVRINLDVYRVLWGDDRINGMALFLPENADVNVVTDDLRAELTGFPRVLVNPNSAMREEALEIFDRTFAITAAMQLVTTIVAFIGILSSLLALQLEKSREMGILRSLGLTIAEMRRLTLWETGLLGMSAGLLSLPTGFILSWILIFIINLRSFGWTLKMQVYPAPFLQAVALAIGAALLAGLYPAWRLGCVQAAEALRGE
jgi:putative ABC transport system permease protein